jgi:hypothetical protein
VGVQFGDEARHLFLEGFAVVFDFLGPDVAAGREDVAVRGDCGWAEAGDVGILTRRRGGAERFRSRSFFLSAPPRLRVSLLCGRRLRAVVADGQRPGMSEYSRGDAEARRDSEAEVFFFSAFSAPPREPALT